MQKSIVQKLGINVKIIATCLIILATTLPTKSQTEQTIKKENTKMIKVEIWSDVMCPFCYIGKRKFETALKQFEHAENVIVEWKSFQLNSELKTDTSKNTIEHLAETKGWTMEYTNKTIEYVLNMAKEVGLNYDFNKAVVANSFDAHRMVQYAKTKGKGTEAEEQLFKAYFIEGKNTADHETLSKLGEEIGLDYAEIKRILSGTEFSNEVHNDIKEAEKVGVTGVPFFVIDRKYAISGAQDPKAFLDALKKAWKHNN